MNEMNHAEAILMEEIIEELYADNQKKLKQICNREMSRFGGLSQKDYDDFYSRVGLELSIARKKFDPTNGKKPIEFAYGVIRQSVLKEMRDKNRLKRQTIFTEEEEDENGQIVIHKKYVPTLSIDAPVNEDDGLTIGDMLQSDFNMDEELSCELDDYYSEKIEMYLLSLSDMQRAVAKLLMKGCDQEQIKDMLHITDKQYRSCLGEMKSYDKKRILFKEKMEMGNMETMMMEENVTEKYKNTSYSIDSISKQLKRKRIRDDHILQRHSGQWKGFAKSELISDILRGKSLTQIIISEEIKNGIKMQWLIDGKQRCTTLDDYLHDGFAISRNVKNYNITYQASKVDENGDEILNEDGFTDMEWKVFDIRGKKFCQLPEELQDIFRDRQIPVLYNMNCTKKDIAEDIARFNRSRPMNKAQNGWLGLDESFAEFVDNIAKMQFFQPEFEGSTYTKINNTSGTIRRIIVESIMVSDFIEEYCDFDKMCEFLSEEASDSNFTEFYSLVERLTLICNTKEIASLFDVKDSFLWFGLFSRFAKLSIDDDRFADFMNEFRSLRRVEIDGKSFDDILLESKATKEKSIVIRKMNHLEKLLMMYLGKCHSENSKITKDQVAEILAIDSEDIKLDMDCYRATLKSLEEKNIKSGSKLLDKENQLSLLAMVVYSYKNDVDLDDWLTEYIKKHNTYLIDQKQNFLYMKEDFEKYSQLSRKIA